MDRDDPFQADSLNDLVPVLLALALRQFPEGTDAEEDDLRVAAGERVVLQINFWLRHIAAKTNSALQYARP